MRILAIILCVAVTAVIVAAPANGADEPTQQTFEGQYDWSSGGKESLAVEFSPNGEDRWKVKFKFRWSGKNYTWKGTAKGSLENGTEVSGTATSGGRDWEWTGTISEAGELTGSHTEVTGGRSNKTGTFSLNR